MSLSIASRSLGDISVLACTGRIVEGAEAAALEASVKKLLPWQPYIVLDLGGVTFVDSCGLGLLLRLRTFARTAAGDLKVCAANRNVVEVLRVTRLDGVLPRYESEVEAIAAFYTPVEGDDPWRSLDVDVLCVHSSMDVLVYAREVLKQAGYGVATASNLSDARVLLRATAPRVLVIDPDSAARLAALTGEPATRLAAVAWPQDFSTEEAGAAAHELLGGVNRAVARGRVSGSES
jgi:anti-sigma B factor antagonist